ncbi:hypothetical protein VNO78_33247 [Psophocarpus tetragonolobus]|uniref:Uncharacterized protein n=1 Tax=Psophocarpus tetragonolobus TaxID=3891 RepID=A0AAN9NX14_PSOTE
MQNASLCDPTTVTPLFSTCFHVATTIITNPPTTFTTSPPSLRHRIYNTLPHHHHDASPRATLGNCVEPLFTISLHEQPSHDFLRVADSHCHFLHCEANFANIVTSLSTIVLCASTGNPSQRRSSRCCFRFATTCVIAHSHHHAIVHELASLKTPMRRKKEDDLKKKTNQQLHSGKQRHIYCDSNSQIEKGITLLLPFPNSTQKHKQQTNPYFTLLPYSSLHPSPTPHCFHPLTSPKRRRFAMHSTSQP